MNKQEEIREGIAQNLEDVFSELDHWDCPAECGHKVCLTEWRDTLTDELLAYLHSQGGVIKVDKELPAIVARGYFGRAMANLTQKDMLKAGFVAVEPLVVHNK